MSSSMAPKLCLPMDAGEFYGYPELACARGTIDGVVRTREDPRVAYVDRGGGRSRLILTLASRLMVSALRRTRMPFVLTRVTMPRSPSHATTSSESLVCQRLSAVGARFAHADLLKPIERSDDLLEGHFIGQRRVPIAVFTARLQRWVSSKPSARGTGFRSKRAAATAKKLTAFILAPADRLGCLLGYNRRTVPGQPFSCDEAEKRVISLFDGRQRRRVPLAST